jgi:hypothetical protein
MNVGSERPLMNPGNWIETNKAYVVIPEKNDSGRGNNRLGSVFDITGTFA